MRTTHGLLTGLLLIALAGAWPGCASSELASSRGAGGAAGGVDGGPSGVSGGGFEIPDGGLGQLSDGSEACAEEIQKGEPVPVDLILLVDSSDSMGSTIGTQTKWQAVTAALRDFVRDPRSAGLGVGLQFFPQPGSGSPCEKEEDCGYQPSPNTPVCQPAGFCGGAETSAEELTPCGERYRACAGGAACVPAGRCVKSALDCTNIGQACSGGLADDLCTALGKRCDYTDNESCPSPAVYQALAVPIGPLPQPTERMVTHTLAARGPSGPTPLGPAVQGAFTALATYLGNHAGHRGVLVLATDGHPSGCQTPDIAGIANLLTDARTSGSRMSTYVIGLFPANDVEAKDGLDKLATAGGTGKAFVVAPMEDLAQRFLDALDQIRGHALPCDFKIPAPKLGPLDFGKVNVTVQIGGGDHKVLYAGSAARCDPTTGGWYYDVDPASGTPTRVMTCDATCGQLKAESSASVEIRFGCKTEPIR